ncbi:MAG: GAF domain-containing protein [Candidatus Omnitrophica bacterium]|nr:GAF domain-containing protein [Candidatus Omnitrophota bacterium]MDD5670427.1 GAF domain-containing protein [Candidatus Omnitrophota bacterium]
MKNKRYVKTVIERFLLPNPQWQEGYKSFARQFGNFYGWAYLMGSENNCLIKLDRKGYGSSSSSVDSQQLRCFRFLQDLSKKITHEHGSDVDLPYLFTCNSGKRAAAFPFYHFGRLRGLVFLCCLSKPESKLQPLFELFEHFVLCHVELAYKNFELNNFYETVHPRALALSTMHSVHRVISSSLRLKELLPRIGRLSAQVLKAKGCSIMLVDSEKAFLVPYFSFGSNPKFVHRHRVRIGKGLQGKMASTGEFHLSRNSIAVPFIEDDIVGIIALWDKIDNQPFTKIDLEILKSLSEHAVVAIKNAQLFEETEQLTLGSIKTINELLELNFGGDRGQLSFFKDLVMEIGKELELSSRELTHLERAILLLDTGALALPEKVWFKKGKLTKKEYDQIKRIPTRGASILKSITSLQPVIPIILHHHERYDGKGYPEGLAGEEIPIGARIVGVVNSFVAMISKRSYREPMNIEQAIQEIQINSGTQFDPRVVECYMKVIRRKEIMEQVKVAQEQIGKMTLIKKS